MKAFRLDLEKLLIPIPGGNPVGEYLRYEITYDSIQEARKEEADLPQGVWERGIKKADWNEVRDICIDALENRSKDLQIAVWLLESLLHLYGFLGLREGLKLITALCEKFWESLYPEIEEEDYEARVSPIVWQNEKLYLQLKMVQITQPESRDESPYSFGDWEKANYLENLADGDKSVLEEAESKGTITLNSLLGRVSSTPRSFYETQCKYLADSIELVTDLEQILDEKCDKQAPTLHLFMDTLEDIYRTVNGFLMKTQSEDANYEPEPSSSEEDEKRSLTVLEEGGQISKKPFASEIRSRSEAYRMLSEAADYLMIHEPHSPTPYLVKRAVSWGNKTFSELVKELVNDDNDLQQIYKLLGIKGLDQR